MQFALSAEREEEGERSFSQQMGNLPCCFVLVKGRRRVFRIPHMLHRPILDFREELREG